MNSHLPFSISETEAVSYGATHPGSYFTKVDLRERLSAAVDLFDLGGTDLHQGSKLGYFRFIADLSLGKLSGVLLRILCDPALC